VYSSYTNNSVSGALAERQVIGAVASVFVSPTACHRAVKSVDNLVARPVSIRNSSFLLIRMQSSSAAGHPRGDDDAICCSSSLAAAGARATAPIAVSTDGAGTTEDLRPRLTQPQRTQRQILSTHSGGNKTSLGDSEHLRDGVLRKLTTSANVHNSKARLAEKSEN